MSIKLPTISWETIINNTSIVIGEDYKYNCTVTPININDPGYGQLEVGYYIVDYVGHIFEIEEISGYDVKVIDLIQDIQFTGPYNEKNGYVFRSLQDAALLAQAKLNRLDESAEDFVRSLGLDPKVLEIDYIDFNTELDPLPEWKEGRLFYDNTDNKKTLSYYNDEEDVTVNIGQELLIRVRNETGATLINGTVVYPVGICAENSCILVDKADAHYFDKSRLVGVVTHDIENDTNGWVTKFGEVGGLDTSGYTGNILFLSATNPGELTDVQPDDGSFITQIAAIKVKDAVEGSIVVDINTTELTVEVTDTNGFPIAQRDNTSLAFNDATRTLTISAISYPFHYYDLGIKYEKQTSESVTIPDAEGEYIIYYNGNVLSYMVNPTNVQTSQLIREECLVVYLYWDATNKAAIYLGDERHGISMSTHTHSYLHFTRGCQYISGLGLDNFIVDANGSLNSHAQFSAGQGAIMDEDFYHPNSTIGSTVGLPIYYLEGPNSYLRYTENTGFSVRTFDNTSATRLAYNKYIDSTTGWQISEVGNNNFTLYHIFAVGAYHEDKKVISIMGQNTYATSTGARAGANTEISNLIMQLPIPELVPIGTIIYLTKDNFTNAVKSTVISTDLGEDYIDWRTSELAQGASPSNHGNLTGLENDDHFQYAFLDGRDGDIQKIDQIDEFNAGVGVTIDGVLLKDNEVNFEYLDKYTNTTPMPEDVGGLEAGSTFNEKQIDEMLTSILYPYQYPSFTSFSIQGQSNPLEVGDSILADRTFIWSTENPTNIVVNSIDILDITNGTTLISGTANDGTQLVTMPAVTKTTATSHTFQIEGTNSKSQLFTEDYTVNWRWRMYYGEGTSSTLTEAGIEALRVNELDTTFVDTYSFNALTNGYKYISYPAVWGTATSFKDTATQLPVPMEPVYIVSVTNVHGVTTNYNVHRSTNILNDAINIIVE